MGDKLAERLNVKIGQTVYASFPDARSTSLGGKRHIQPPRLAGGHCLRLHLHSSGLSGDGDVLTGVDVKLEDVLRRRRWRRFRGRATMRRAGRSCTGYPGDPGH